MRKVLFFIGFLVLISCEKEKNYNDFFQTSNEYSKIRKENLKINIDTIKFDNIPSSYIGELKCINDNFLFIDYRFCKVFIFDNNGKFLVKKIGQGFLTNEINTSKINRFCFENDKYLIIGDYNDFHFFNSKWEKIQSNRINWNSYIKYGESRNVINPKHDEPTIYSFDFTNHFIKSLKNKIYIPIYSEHKNFNGLTKNEYYHNSRIIAEIDISDSTNVNVKRILGRRTPKLLKYQFLPQYSGFSFDIDSKGNFYINYEIDPYIYVYDNDFNLKYKLGHSGIDMDTTYLTINNYNLKKFRQLLNEDKPNRGYYTNIKVFEDQNLIFRSYKKSKNSEFDGLQVYKNKILISDQNIPKNLEISFYYNGYYYSNIQIDEENEKMFVYKIKINF